MDLQDAIPPNRLAASLTDSKGADVSISERPYSGPESRISVAIGEDKEETNEIWC